MSARLLAALGAGLLAGVAACGSDPAPAPAPAALASASSASVRWTTARAPGATSLLEAPAQVLPAPAGRAVITAPLPARILAVHVQPGAIVEAGAPLVDVMLPEAAAAAGAYLAASEEIEAHERRGAQLEGLRQEGLGRASEVAAVQLELARLRGTRNTAAATLRAAGLAVGDARALVGSGGRTALRAPIAGTVVAVAALLGASRPSEEPLVELAAGGATRLEARLPRPLPPGMRAEFVAVGGAPIEARYVGSAPAQEADGTTRAWFELATPAAAGATGRLRGTLPTGAAVVVPAAALLREGAEVFVWRREGDQPRRIPVRVLATSGADALIEGLEVGAQVAAVATAIEAS